MRCARDPSRSWMASYSDILFGRIVLKNGLAPDQQVATCLRQKPQDQSLGEALIERGLISPSQARKVQRAQALMQFMRAEKAFARILHERRLVDLPTLKRCFQRQEKERYRIRIGQILVEEGRLTPAQNEQVVDEQLMLLAEETARIEEQGLRGTLAESSGQTARAVDDLTRVREVEDLENSRMKEAVGPRGLFDAPSRELIRRTLPVMKAASLESGPRPAAEVEDDELVGRTIASRYRILSKIGEGGMGTVYKAEHCLMEKIVALKVLNPGLVSSRESLERFRHEIRAASRFQHKNVIQIYDAGEGEGGIFYMAMEFAQGETLEAQIQRKGALAIDRALSYFRQTLRAVGEAHKKNIVHRDLKSGNLMITRSKEGLPLVKVMDFGIAKIAFDEQEAMGAGPGLYRTQEGIVTGTPQYMSPEQASGESVDHRSDLYSIGVILFEMLTGELPFRSNTPMGFLGKHIVEPPPRPGTVKEGIPVVLEEIALKLLEKKPDDRYQSAEEALADIELRCSGENLQIISSSGASRRAPALTVAVAPPKGLRQPPTAAVPSVGRRPLGSDPVAEERSGRPVLLFVGLIILLLLVVSGSTTLAIVLSKGAGSGQEHVLDPAAIAKQAEALLAEGEFDKASAALEEALEAITPPPSELQELLARVRKAEADADVAAGLVSEADRLADEYMKGVSGQQAATEAMQRYEHALSLHEDAEVRGRYERLTRKIDADREADSDKAQEGTELILQGHEAVTRGDLGAAAAKLRKVEMLLPSSDERLTRLKKYLRAARLVDAGKAARSEGKLEEARAALQEAEPLHPDAQTRTWIQRELVSIDEEIRREGERAAVKGLLERALAAAVKLDIGGAGKLLDEARAASEESGGEDDPLLARRRASLEKLRAFAGDLVEASDALKDLERNKRAVSVAEARGVVATLRGFRERLEGLADDPALQAGVSEWVEAQAARATALADEIAKLKQAAKSQKLERFERQLARLREWKDVIETPRLVEERLGDLLDLQETPSYVSGECSAEDRKWLDSNVRVYLSRRTLWQDLRPVEGAPAMIQVRGEHYTSLSGKEYDLPAVYYIAATEVTCAEWRRFTRATGTREPPGFKPSDKPITFVSLRDAQSYCRWRSKRPDGSRAQVRFRLPSEPEWEFAVRGAKGTRYPWGDGFEGWREGYAAVDGKIVQVGRFQRDKTERGLYDVVGNVSEMTTLFGNAGQVVLKGGSASSQREDTGAHWRRELRKGDEVSGYVGLRLVAVERTLK